MAAQELQSFLLWCTLLNYSVLIIWFVAFQFGHHWLFALHKRWFNLNPASFDALHYGSMAIYKILILTFNLVPLIALSIGLASRP